MVREFFRGTGEEDFEPIEGKINQMLADCRHSFDAAVNAVLGGIDPELVGPDLRVTDQRVNKLEQEVRRELLVHASVHGTTVDVPLIMTYMNVVKDIERVGDYAKNIYDLAAQGADFSAARDLDDLVRYRDRVSELISEVATVFRERDQSQARRLAEEGDRLLDDFDEQVRGLVESDAPSRLGVPRALLYRYLKRIVAHLLNVLSAVIMPVDRLDYFDEDRADRV
jgi:phosphate uptake regulator